MDAAPGTSQRALSAGALVFAALVGGALVAAVFAGEGSGAGGILPVGGAAVLLLAGAAVAVAVGKMPAPRVGRSGAALVVALLALCAWIGVTVAWSIVPDRSWDAFSKSLVFAAFLGLGVVLGGVAGRAAARLGAALLALVVGAALVWALLSKALPGLDPDGARVARLNEPVDYWNGLALLADTGLVLGLWLGTMPGRRRLAGVAGGLLVYAATLVLLLTLSRVGLIAGVAVVLLWLAISRERVQGGLLLAAAAGPAVLVGAWAFTRPALVEAGAARSDRVADGALFAGLALAGALVAAALVAVGSRRELGERGRRRSARALAAAAVAACALVAVGVALALGDAVSSGRSCAEVVNDPGRLATLDPNMRLCWWSEAWDVFAFHSPEGAGAGTFEIARKRFRSDARAVFQPHSVPLQQLADGGVAGLSLFVLVVLAGAWVCVCALRRLDGLERAAAAALVAAPAAYLVHSLVDYSWDFLAVTAPTMTALGVLAVAGRSPGRRRGRPLLGVSAVLLAGALLVSFAGPRLAERSVRASTDALVAEDFERARDDALWARFWNPLSVQPVFALARIDERRGFPRAAERRYVQAVELQPENPETWYALGLFELQVLENVCAGYQFLNEAYTRDPVGNQWVEGGELDQARDAVNAGACG